MNSGDAGIVCHALLRMLNRYAQHGWYARTCNHGKSARVSPAASVSQFAIWQVIGLFVADHAFLAIAQASHSSCIEMSCAARVLLQHRPRATTKHRPGTQAAAALKPHGPPVHACTGETSELPSLEPSEGRKVLKVLCNLHVQRCLPRTLWQASGLQFDLMASSCWV